MKTTMGALIKDLRLKAGLSQQALADKIQMSKAAISAIENGANGARGSTTSGSFKDAGAVAIKEVVEHKLQLTVFLQSGVFTTVTLTATDLQEMRAFLEAYSITDNSTAA